MAQLKFMLANLDNQEDATKSLYVKHDDGNFYLDVEGAVSKTKVDEFRENNIGLKKDLDDVKTKYKDVDLDQYNELRDKAALDDGKKRVSMDKVDEIVSERTGAMKAEHETQIKERDDRISNQGRQLNGLLIDSAVRDAATTAGVMKGAVSDVILRAQSTFKIVDGKAVAHDSEGKVVYGSNGSDPLTTSEWVGGLKKTAEHLFESSKGTGGGSGGTGGGTGGGAGDVDPENMSALQKIQSGMDNQE